MKIKIFIYVVTLFILSACDNKTRQCNEFSDQNLINRALISFENDIFSYYGFKNDTTKTYKKFLSEISDGSVALQSLASKNSLDIANTFLEQAKTDNSLWIYNYDLNEKYAEEQNEEEEILITQNSDFDSEAYKRLKAEEEIMRLEQKKKLHILNYEGPIIQCLKNNTKNKDLTRIIKNLEQLGPIHQTVIANALNRADPVTFFKSKETKAFIAFEIYYNILILIQQ